MESDAITIPIVMIAHKDLQRLLGLPLAEKLQIAQQLIESALTDAHSDKNGQSAGFESAEISKGAEWLLSMKGRYSGGKGDTAARVDEICASEIDHRSGFTTKPPLDTER